MAKVKKNWLFLAIFELFLFEELDENEIICDEVNKEV